MPENWLLRKRATALPIVFAALAGLVFSNFGASAQGNKRISGTATYRERIALPPGAVLEALLEDVSQAGTLSETIASIRVEGPGQPPFRISIPYDPKRIRQGRMYSVRVRVLSGDQLLFITDRQYPVLTLGHDSRTGMMLLRRVRNAVRNPGSAEGQPRTVIGPLPASFAGELPCADCPQIRYALNLFPDGSFFLSRTYAERGDGSPMYETGRWQGLDNGSTLVLRSGGAVVERFAIEGRDALRKLDQDSRPIESSLNYELRRTQAFLPVEPRLLFRGMFHYMADAATFTDCATGQRWPVAMQDRYKALESTYLKLRQSPGDSILAILEGRVSMLPKVDSKELTATLTVLRFDGLRPGENCP